MRSKNHHGVKTRKSPMPFLPGPGKREMQRKLNWLIGFLNADTQVLNPGEFVKLLDEVFVFFYGDQLGAGLRKILCSDTDLNRQAVLHIQGWTEWYLRGIVTTENTFFRDGKIRCTGDYARVIGDVVIRGNQVKLVYRKSLRPYDANVRFDFGYEERREDWQKTIDQEYVDQEFANLPDDKKEKHAFFSNFCDSDIPSSVLLSLVPLLENFPLECIRRCPKCGKYFTSTRKKKSALCRYCLKRESMHHWLRKKENRDAWNEYNRNLRKGIVDEKPTQIRERLKAESKEKEEENGTNS